MPRLRRGIAQAGALALATAAFTGPATTAEEPADTLGLRLTRLAGSEPAAAFSVATPDGRALALGDFRGQIVLLNFWATWCEPCLEEMPALERLGRSYRARGLVVLALSVDREGAAVVGPFETRNLGGKCADLNALYVGFARAVGIPARDVYGIRVAESAEFKSLGKGGDITKAQHCRAEFYLAGHGWVPVDPADVRKVVLEEKPGGLPLDDPLVQKARAKLFGAWEMNWMAYNYAHDVKLPGSAGAPVAFLMYPQAETAEGRRDSLDPDHFRYVIKSREIAL